MRKRKQSRDKEADAIAKRLGEVKLVVRRGFFRSTTHFFNTKVDIEIAVQKLASIFPKMRLLEWRQ